MKRLLMACIVFFLSTVALLGGVPTKSVRVLTDFTLQEEGDTITYNAQLPGYVQATLIEKGVIPHHFVDRNEDSVQWVSDRNWLYMTKFEVGEDELKSAEEFLLSLEYVDTYGEIYLNGALVGRTDNLFQTYDLEVKDFLRVGENRLVIRLLSTTQVAHAYYISNGFNYPADNDRSDIKYSPFVRKSAYHFGWDWGPRLISMGVGGEIKLVRVVGPTAGAVYVASQIDWDQAGHATHATVSVTSSVNHRGGAYTEHLYLIDPQGNRVSVEPVLESENSAEKSYTFAIKEPKLWQPSGWGEQSLYALVREVVAENSLDTDTTFFGIREIELIQEDDEIGQSFYFKVNNRPFYAKGANYLPHDRRFGGGGRTLEGFFLHDLVAANFNMIRVWGGGTYETEEFYQLADRYGILVWQDFPFSCTTYPNDPKFRESVAKEAKDQLSRIRNHPSLALLCGNNEVLEGLRYWGWKKAYSYSDQVWEQMFKDYDSFFRELLPSFVATYVPHVQYIDGSPLDSTWGHPEGFLKGDSHNWRVWFGSQDFDDFDYNPGRFSSEFGFQSFPEMKTIQSFAPGYDLDALTIESPVLKHRQRSFIGNQRITEYMERDYPVPTDFSDYVYVGQVLHGRGMGYSLRSIRRSYPINMGSLYWQLNDVWPTVSWSSVDYWGNFKSLHYRVKEAYAPYVIDVVSKGKGADEVEVVALWDAINHNQKLKVQAIARDYDGKEIFTTESDYFFSAESPHVERGILTFSKQSLPKNSFIEVALLDEMGNKLATNVFYPVRPKEMPLSYAIPEVSVSAKSGELTVTLKSETLIKDLFVETPWQGARYNDNYFDLLPGQPKIVVITHPDITAETTVESLGFQSMNMILHKYPSHD